VLDNLESTVIGSVIQAVIAIFVDRIYFNVFVFADEIDDQDTKKVVKSMTFYLLSDGSCEHERGSSQLRHREIEVLPLIEDSHVKHVLVVSTVDSSHDFMLDRKVRRDGTLTCLVVSIICTSMSYFTECDSLLLLVKGPELP
jgi:hypothetical protein